MAAAKKNAPKTGPKRGPKRGLGMGLSALLGPAPHAGADTGGFSGGFSGAFSGGAADGPRETKRLAVGHLHPGRYQPRHAMDDAAIGELARSISAKGVLQPLLVRAHPERKGEYEIIAGERRWRAAQKAQLHEVPVIIRELTDSEALEIALVENLQREDLSPLDEAIGYRRLMEEFSHTQEKLASALGKSRSHVANMMRLLELPEKVRAMLDRGDLSAGHARALLKAADPVALAQAVIKKGLNVRQTERLVRDEKNAGGKGKGKAGDRAAKDADTLALERDLANLLGLRVEIKHAGGAGTLAVHYKTLEQLDDVLARLSRAPAGGGRP